MLKVNNVYVMKTWHHNYQLILIELIKNNAKNKIAYIWHKWMNQNHFKIIIKKFDVKRTTPSTQTIRMPWVLLPMSSLFSILLLFALLSVWQWQQEKIVSIDHQLHLLIPYIRSSVARFSCQQIFNIVETYCVYDSVFDRTFNRTKDIWIVEFKTTTKKFKSTIQIRRNIK